MIKVLKYIHLLFPLVIVFYYSIQIFNKVNDVRIEGYTNALASIMFFFTNLIFLILFLLTKRSDQRKLLICCCWIFGALFLLGIFLSNTYLWLAIIVVTSILILINLSGKVIDKK